VGARALAGIGSALRAAYGLGAFAAPGAMGRARLTGRDLDAPDARLFVRGFGAHQLLIAGFTAFAALRDEELLRPALVLSLLLDAVDVASAAAEVPSRGRIDLTLAGGFAISGGGMALFALALHGLDR
jgi:hypothetical protein